MQQVVLPAPTREAEPRWLAAIRQELEALLPRQRAIFAEAREAIPGGTTRARFFWPFPLYVERGEGAYLWDADGRRYVDCNVGFGAQILGHAHPQVIAAIEEALKRGSFWGCPATNELQLAERIVSSYPGAERVFFVNSGTEATFAALRLARAFTGRTQIAKIEGGWHGWHDFSTIAYKRFGGTRERPLAIADTLGLPQAATDGVTILPFDHPAALDTLERQGEHLAALIMEPMLASSGALPASPEFVSRVRELTQAAGCILIFDEVVTGFRLGPGGCADFYGVQPDLATFGKIIGGGLPAGAVAGRADILDRIALGGTDRIFVAGTFSGNPTAMAAGNATLDLLLADDGAAYLHLRTLATRLRTHLDRGIDDLGVPAHVTGLGSIWSTHFLPEKPRDARAAAAAPHNAMVGLAALLLANGIFCTSPAHLGFLSTAHTETDVDQIVAAHLEAVARLTKVGAFNPT